jgi:cellobiose-specific phosphotransferase system component IIA
VFDDAWLTDLLLDRNGMLSDAGVAQELAATLATRHPTVDGQGIATRALLEALDQTWERGWQPADVVHTARRVATAGSVTLVVRLIGEHARRTDATSRAPETWMDQLRELSAVPPQDPDVVAAWHRAEGRTPAEAWRVILLLIGFLRTAVRIEVLVPPPSRWGPPRTRAAVQPTPGDDRALRRIRGLLAKAESTDFPDEAEALTAKAQELMTRHAVDAALLGADASSGGVAVDTRRVHVQDPYVRAKMQLLAAVAEANDVRLVWYQSLGIANLVGATSDADAVELLFTSLLLQVAQALATAERPLSGRSSSRSFRRSFLLGYAHRIGERLTTARERATAEAAAAHGVDLLPVLRSRQAAVEERVAELFPRVRASRSRSSVDAGGWYAGRAAAERADVGRRGTSLG